MPRIKENNLPPKINRVSILLLLPTPTQKQPTQTTIPLNIKNPLLKQTPTKQNELINRCHSSCLKEMFYLMMHSTHFYLCIYGIRYMIKDQSESEKGNPLPPLHGLPFLISNKGSFICTIPQAG